MSVTITLSKTVNGSGVADTLSGGSTGLDIGSCVNGNYAPVITQSANSGKQDLYLRHNAVIDPITDLRTYIDVYSGTYGGAATAASDYAAVKALGQASGSSKNNNDGLSGGLWIDMDWQVTDADRFDISTRSAEVKIYGDNGTDGISQASAFNMHVDAMSYWNGTAEVDATTPVTGRVGISTDTVLGNRAHMQYRIYLPTSQADGGVFQFDIVFLYNYTA